MAETRRKATYAKMKELLGCALDDLEILAGNKMGPSSATWQDVAGTCATNLQVLVWQLEQARAGNCEPFITFPSPVELMEEEDVEISDYIRADSREHAKEAIEAIRRKYPEAKFKR